MQCLEIESGLGETLANNINFVLFRVICVNFNNARLQIPIGANI